MDEMEIEFVPDFALDDPKGGSIEELVDAALGESQWESDKKNQRCVIIDIDGTLADVRGGIEYDKNGEFDWKNFFKAIAFYPPNEWAVRMTQIYYQMGFVVHIVTGRPSQYRKKTTAWLDKYAVPYDYLYMREEGDMRKDEVVKKEILDREFKDKSLIEFCLDDRPEIVKMWRENGLTCLACNPHTFI